MANATEIRHYLESLADPVIAEHSSRYFKTGKGEYGYGDKFLGIRVPEIRKAVRQFKTSTLKTIEKLLHSKYHEVRLFAVFSLVERFKTTDVNVQQSIYELYLSNTRYINNRDLIDTTAHRIVGAWLLNRNRKILYKLAKSELLWERRISIMATLCFINHDQFEDTLIICELLINDHEDLIHKACGWMLREIGNRNKKAEQEFLIKYATVMPRTMLRYAIEKFPKTERQRYLAM